MQIFYGYLFSFGYLFAVIFLTGLLKKLFKFELEVSRKLIHIFISFTWIILYHYLRGTWHFVIVPLCFVIINYLSYRFKIFKMFERDDNTKNHFGTVYYAVAMTVMSALTMFVPELLLPYGISVFCLSFGDGAAALFGSTVKNKKIYIRPDKSLVGTLSCVAFAALGVLILGLFIPIDIAWWGVLALGVVTAAAELVGFGLDNFSIPACTMLLSWLLLRL